MDWKRFCTAFSGERRGGSGWGVAFGNKGVIYGTTSYGGSDNFGTVYSLTPPSAPGDSWIETTLHSFTGKGNDGTFRRHIAVAAWGILWHDCGGLRKRCLK